MRADEKLAESVNESARTVQRFIRLTELISELLDMVDERKLAFNPAVEVSYLKRDEQRMLLEAMDAEQTTPSLSQAQRLKKFSQEGRLTEEAMSAIGELTGRSVREDVTNRIFERFYRVDSSRVRSDMHHGLGLSIVRAIALMHHGEAFVRSVDGVNTFGFSLALSLPEEHPITPTSEPVQASPAIGKIKRESLS